VCRSARHVPGYAPLCDANSCLTTAPTAVWRENARAEGAESSGGVEVATTQANASKCRVSCRRGKDARDDFHGQHDQNGKDGRSHGSSGAAGRCSKQHASEPTLPCAVRSSWRRLRYARWLLMSSQCRHTNICFLSRYDESTSPGSADRTRNSGSGCSGTDEPAAITPDLEISVILTAGHVEVHAHLPGSCREVTSMPAADSCETFGWGC
jgi:hypothetical protein